MMQSTVDLTSSWLDAIDRATACLRAANSNGGGQTQRSRGGQQQQRGPTRSANHISNNNSSNHIFTIDESISYLALLEKVLLEHQLFWDQPPTIPPPDWIPELQQPTVSIHPQAGVLLPPNINTPPMTRHYVEASSATETTTNNPFATFQSDIDDDDDDEAGDRPTVNYFEPPPPPPVAGASSIPPGKPMVLRRVLIRVVTSMSEVYAHKASACRQERPPTWKLGADTYGQSLFKIHEALQLADSEISRLINHQQQQQQSIDHNGDDWMFQDLVQDADIVEVAIQYLTQERDRYRQECLQQEQYLLKRLHPQWQSRDQARARMGDRWVQNPAPKNDYWHRRRQDEYQLRDIQEALAQLNQVDTDLAQANSQKLKKRLKQSRQGGGNGIAILDETNNSNDNTIRLIEQREQRYNGQRPLDYSKRVPWEDYPDPTNHGWTFTGSWEASLVEFFERAMGAEGEVVKLDWYYTTATMKTSLHHPTQGKTQMFANRVTPAVYREILLNPRTHTSQRYQTRNNRPNNNNNNSNNHPQY